MGFPNVLHNDKWNVVFSNIPSLSGGLDDMKYFDNYIKGVTIPSYTMGEIISQLPFGNQIRHPLGPKVNQDLGVLNMSFKVSENMYNYLILFLWMKELRTGKLNRNHEDIYRKYTIRNIYINYLDNQKRIISRFNYTNAWLTDLGSLSLSYGESNEVSFDCSFTYEDLVFETFDLDNGSPVLTPTNVTECGISGVSQNPTIVWGNS